MNNYSYSLRSLAPVSRGNQRKIDCFHYLPYGLGALPRARKPCSANRRASNGLCRLLGALANCWSRMEKPADCGRQAFQEEVTALQFSREVGDEAPSLLIFKSSSKNFTKR